MRIAVGIPSFNEAATIQNVAAIADRGLSTYFGNHDCVLINMDNASSDGTSRLFERVKTCFPKEVLRNEERGKGHNVRSLFEYMVREKIDCACTIDADLQSISPQWIQQLLSPLVLGGTGYVVPVYERSKYDATTTNHFCYPLITALYGVPIRQPIAGEFGFDRAFAARLLASHWPLTAYEYGIDILMTLQAVLAGFNVEEVYLGQKVHNTSWPKTKAIFLQAAGTMLMVIKNHGFRAFEYRGRFVQADSAVRRGVGVNGPLLSEDDIRNAEAEALASTRESLGHRAPNPLRLVQGRILDQYQSGGTLTGADWMRAVADALRVLEHDCRNEQDVVRLTRILQPFNILRAVSCFRESDELGAEAVEQIFEDQIALLRGYLAKQ